MQRQLFKAAILTQHNAPLELMELEVPQDLYVGQALVKVAYSGLCASQLNEISGVKGQDKYLPHSLGHEGSGIVQATGPGVSHVKIGDHVVLHWRKGKGIESQPPKYWCPALKRDIGGGWVTSFNEYAVVSENRLTRIDKSVNLAHAALLGCAVTTGLGLICNEAQVKIGQSVLVLGCGGVGQNVIQGAKLAGAHPIVGVDIIDDKLIKAVFFGATLAFKPADVPAGSKFDLVVDTTGRAAMMKAAWEYCAADGQVCLVAQLPHDQYLPLQTLPMHTGKRIFGSDGGGTDPSRDIPRYLRLYAADKLDLANLITHTFGLTQINEGLDAVRAGKVTRAIIQM